MTTSSAPVYLAVDLGASSGRVLAATIGQQGIELDEVHRFPNGAVPHGKRLLWNLLGQWEHLLHGLTLAAQRYGDSIRSLGVDTWGVDYVLLDGNDDPVGPSYCYRDPRLNDILDYAFELMPREQIFAETGIQFLQINTAFQLLAMRREGSALLDIAERLLMVPDYFHWLLSGEKVNEFTNASTTQLLNPINCRWSKQVIRAFGLPEHIFSEPEQPGKVLGNPLPFVQERTGLSPEVAIVLPATHDTASAVLAVPAADFAAQSPDWCYISCGTWSLMGAELASPVLTAPCLEFNFTNEGGVGGSVRLLKNISGLWIVQQCREQWKREGKEYSWEQLIALAEEAPRLTAIIDPDDGSFVAPSNMPQAIRDYCQRSGQPAPLDEGAMIRCALESLALRYRFTLERLELLVGNSLNTIHLVGGGSRNRMLCQFAADACQRPVIAGPVEATAMGNVAMQAIGLGDLESVHAARTLIRNSPDITTYAPQPDPAWDAAYDRLTHLIEHGTH
ncbi:MAG: carbohydrate kinase [Pirellulaceae bacterium]|nr:MAG: carbohydrate kinase [Pirellulaceae bacterium]